MTTRRIFFWAPWNTINVWRSEWPAMDLRRRGYDARVIDRFTPGAIRERVEQVLEPDDVVIFHVTNMIESGLTDFVLDILPRCRHLLLSFDDDYTAHADVQVAEPPKLLLELRQSIPRCSGIICATEGVAEGYAQYQPKTSWVIPNRMPEAVARYRYAGRHKPKVCYMTALRGMDAPAWLIDPHYLDLYEIADELRGLPIHVVGGSEGQHEVLEESTTWEPPTEPDIRWPRRKTGRLYRTISRYAVGMAPLRDTQWNNAKSWIKPLEFAAVGVPVVCSPSREYVRLLEEGTPILPVSKGKWREALDMYLGLPERDLRRWSNDLVAGARDQAIERYDEWSKMVENLSHGPGE